MRRITRPYLQKSERAQQFCMSLECANEIRTGYFPWLMERKSILLAMYERISKKEKVLLNKRVKGIEYVNSKPVVSCTDGTIYHGDVIVGADGVHSVTRSEMWRLAEADALGSIPLKDKTCE
jgi:2-polyprenyl-6-methoxyphenol hydroxylase-like FAD-dependent oxidoreductase